MDKLKEAKRIRRNMGRQIERLRLKALLGSDNEAPLKMLNKVTEMDKKLAELGFRIKDGGKMVPITEAWIARQSQLENELVRLRESARAGDPAAIREFLRAIMESDE